MNLPKKSLLIGINYVKTPYVRLNGCINDILNMSGILMDAFNYHIENITMLRDDTTNPNYLPTKKNILFQLNNLIQQSEQLSEIWIHYSGHGSQIRDVNGDEIDGRDEIIIPSDYNTQGIITDDDIFNIVSKSKCKTVLVFDSCCSGTICDFQWSFTYENNTVIKKMENEKRVSSNPYIYCLSACKDSQTAIDMYDPLSSRYCGTFTNTLLYALRMNRINVDLLKLYKDVCDILLKNGTGKDHLPQLSCSSSITEIPVFKRDNGTDTNNTLTTISSVNTKIISKNIQNAPRRFSLIFR